MMRGPSQGTPSAPKTNPLRAATRQPVGLANPQAFLCYANAFLQATVPMAKAWGPSIAKHELYKTWVAMCAYTGPVLGAKFATDLRDMIPANTHSNTRMYRSSSSDYSERSTQRPHSAMNTRT